jgi:quercetin dioxygenase-like cupin family protein
MNSVLTLNKRRTAAIGVSKIKPAEFTGRDRQRNFQTEYTGVRWLFEGGLNMNRRSGILCDFPEFMKKPENMVPVRQQNTPDVQGYYYTTSDGSQMVFWTCLADRISKEHIHDYDEYMACLSGEYVVTIDGKETVLHAGDEIVIPKGTLQGGRCKAGTRTIHAFGGKRIVQE